MSSVLVSPLFPLSIKVLRGNGDVSVTRVGLLLRVLADTGVSSLVDIQISVRAEVPRFSVVTQ